MTAEGLHLYVDGSPGPEKGEGWTGWGMVLMRGEKIIFEACGRTAERISNNGAEIEALNQGLAYLLQNDFPTLVTLWTDSKYAAESVSCLERKLGQAELKNRARLEFCYDLLHAFGARSRCVIRLLKGHLGCAGNERADKLSKLASGKGEAWFRSFD